MFATRQSKRGQVGSPLLGLPYPKNTVGAMLKKLDDGEADLAITVTDGFIAGRAAGSNVSLIGTYVESPLTWAVCAAPDSKLNSIEDFMRKGREPPALSCVSLPHVTRK